MPDNRKNNIVTGNLPKVSIVFLALGSVGGYLGSEIVLISRSHPIHWIAAGVTAILAFLVGMMIYERFGDIF